MTLAVSGPELVGLGASLRAEAARHDRAGVRRHVADLLEAIEDHRVLAEADLRRLSSFSARLVRRGHERLLQEVLVLAVEVHTGADPHRWEHQADEIATRLAVQAEVEARAFARARP